MLHPPSTDEVFESDRNQRVCHQGARAATPMASRAGGVRDGVVPALGAVEPQGLAIFQLDRSVVPGSRRTLQVQAVRPTDRHLRISTINPTSVSATLLACLLGRAPPGFCCVLELQQNQKR